MNSIRNRDFIECRLRGGLRGGGLHRLRIQLLRFQIAHHQLNQMLARNTPSQGKLGRSGQPISFHVQLPLEITISSTWLRYP